MRKRINRWISSILAASLLFTSMEMPSFAAGETVGDGNENCYESLISEDENEDIYEQPELDIIEDDLGNEADIPGMDDPVFSISQDEPIEADDIVYDINHEDNDLLEDNYEVGELVDLGTCGTNATWSLTAISSNGLELSIKGSGMMEDFNSNPPWEQYSYKIYALIIQEGIESIGDRSFSGIEIQSVIIPNSVLTIGKFAFANCDKLEIITFGENLQKISTYAFYDCSRIQNVVLPDTLNEIGAAAFCDCDLCSVVIPKNVRTVGKHAFKGNNILKSIGPYGGDYDIEYKWETKIPSEAFCGCESITDVCIGDGIKEIGIICFSECIGIKNVLLPESIERIGGNAFYGCSSLEAINIPSKVTSIKSYSFYGCKSLKELSLPEGIIDIGEKAFYECRNLSKITIPNGVKYIYAGAFFNCSNLSEVKLSNSLSTISNELFCGCSKLEKIEIPDGVVLIGNASFSGCTKLEGVSIPYSVTNIADDAFAMCNSLQDVYYEANESAWNTIIIGEDNLNFLNASIHFETNYGSGWFGKKVIWSVNKDGVCIVSGNGSTTDDWGWYSDHPAPWYRIAQYIKEIIIEDGITRISSNSFKDCVNLVKLSIPKSVESIGDDAFKNCNDIQQIYYSGSKSEWEELSSGVTEFSNVTVYYKITVVFDANGGTVMPKSKVIEKGKAYGDLPVPDEREGYTFLGWFTEKEGGTEVKSTTKVTNGETHTIYAHWKAAQVKVSFDANGGTVATSYKTVDFGSEYGQLPVPMWGGYTFDGWYTEKTGGEKITEESIVDTVENHTLYAHWKGKSVKVTFDDNYGNVVSFNIAYGDAYGELPVPKTREHMQFLGWFTEKEGGKQITEDTVMESQEPVTLYAHWKGETYTVTFDANEGKTVNTSIKVEFGQKYGELPKTSREGYIFGGWYTEKEEGEMIDESSIVTIAEDHTLYAHWGNTPVESVTLDKKTLQMLIGEEAQLTATVSPADATNLKVIWSSSDDTVASVSDGKVSANKAGKAVINATTEDGGYTDTCEVTVSTAYKLTFMVDDAVYATIFVKEGQVAEKVDPPVSDRKFVGWYYNDQLWNPSSPVYSDMVLVAHFKDEAEEESGSALDSQPDLNADSIILVKGQKFVVEGDGWISSDKSVLTVNKKGNVTAKKPTSSVGLSRIVGGKTVKSIKVTIKQPNIEPGFTLYVGKDKKISLTGITGLNAIWISSATDVAVVDGEGVVQALSKGSATISAIINGVEFKCKVTVKDADTSKKNFSNTVELVPMQSTNVKVSGFKASKATWSSDLEAVPASKLGKGVVYENAVVRITKSGKLTAIGVGETELTATSGSAALKFKIVVSAPVTQIVHLNVNSSKTIKIYGTKGALAWRGEVNGLQITKNKIKALSSGMRTITAQYENFEYKVIIYAEDPSIVTKEISGAYPKYTLQMKVGEAVAITEKETYQNILYRSNKNNIAFVDEAGVITARSSGKATITAKVNGKKITIIVNVTD